MEGLTSESMLHFCTYFDSSFLARGLALYDSLCEHCRAFELFVLCLDADCYQELCRRNLPGIVPVPISAIEEAFPELPAVKPSRSRVEYYYSCGPAYIYYLLTRNASIELLMYLDADLFFFSDVEPLLEEMEGHSIGVIEHRFSPSLQDSAKFGIYNVGWLAFRNDAAGRACAKWWHERCIEWCYNYCDGERFADQKYLEQWPKLFDDVCVVQHQGANVAPWNLGRFNISEQNGQLLIDGQKLLFFHFHGFKQVANHVFDTNLGRSGVLLSAALRNKVFRPYIQALRRRSGKTVTNGVRKPASGILRQFIGTAWHLAASLVARSYMIVPGK